MLSPTMQHDKKQWGCLCMFEFGIADTSCDRSLATYDHKNYFHRFEMNFISDYTCMWINAIEAKLTPRQIATVVSL